MLGYVRIRKEDLTFREYEEYRGIYCTLCRRIGKRYGHAARWLLSYDMTFVAALRMALREDAVSFCAGRCPYNPFAKRSCCSDTETLDTVADLSLLLSYGQLQDTVADGRGPKRLAAWVLLKRLKRGRKTAAAHLPQMASLIDECLTEQATCERENSPSVDRASDATARMTEAALRMLAADEGQERALARLGYCLGRWIYLMDAADDLEKDAKSGNYNPLLAGEGTPDLAALRERAERALCASLNECVNAYDLLPVRRFDRLLRNILENGCPTLQRSVTHPEKKGS